MAEKKKPARTATPKKPSSAGKGKTAKGKPRQPAAKKQTRAEWEYQRRRMIAAFILFGVTVLCALLYFISGDKLWHSIHQLYRGVFGFFGFLVPGITFYCCWQNGKEEASENYIKKTIYFSFLVLLLSAIVFSFQTDSSALNGYLTEIHNSFILAAEEKGTGAAGAILGIPAAKLLGSVGGGIVCIIAFLILLAVTFDDLTIRLIQSFRRPVRRVGERISDNRQIKQEVTRRKREIDEQQRQKKREEYVRSEIDRRIASHEKKQEDPQLRRIKKTPFYVPDAPEDQRPDKKSKSDKKSAPKPAAPVVDDNEPDDIFFTEEDITIPYTEHPEQKEDEIDLPFLPADMPEEVPDSSPAKQPQKSRKSAPAAEENFVVPDDSSYYIAGNYVKPPFNLLEPQPADSEANISLELNQNAGMIIETLKSFGVNATIVNISRGPSVTRYELQPAAGVKISKITGLADDIAMSLAAVGVRIEAPIPGKAAVGLEVPNKTVTTVKMRGLVESKEFQEAKSKLTVALGKDIAGKITLADLGKMPHLLIAGSTGSGKSVCINAMLVSLLYKASPDEVKLMLIDPKVVELGVYNGIPHLLVPVVTDPRKAAGALNWAVNEMLNRYKTFAEYNVRDMQGYNRYVDRQNASVGEDPNTEAHTDDNERSFEEDEMLAQAQSELGEGGSNNKKPEKLEKMPHIVIVIDELADLMMAAPKDVEEAICRLAQMARAAGMHLVIATQRPSVDVITGLIKANVPSRIAFAVKTQIDSRTILDTGGAEKLLGKGDMLFSPIGTTKPKRIQGCFVDDSEIENIIEFVKKNKGVEYDESVMEEIERNAVAEAAPKGEESEGDGDSLLEEAIRCVVDAGQASTSMLQRRFRVGYARAGRLIDEMEQMGIIGPHEGAKPRQVLITRQQWMERNVSQDN